MRAPWMLLLTLACAAPSPSEPDASDVSDTPDASCANPGPLGSCRDGIDAGDEACAPANGECIESSGCCGGLACLGDADPICGICQRTPDDCDRERPCGEGLVCHERLAPPCSCTGAPVRTCEEPCPTRPCAEDERCDPDGTCRPRPCTDGFECPAGFLCGDAASTDAHGCGRAVCDTDRDCDPGLRCRTSTRECVPPGRCSLPPP